eukprot:COSAG02_NODE_55_length_43887_cov_30.660364_24_plen_53_part_00
MLISIWNSLTTPELAIYTGSPIASLVATGVARGGNRGGDGGAGLGVARASLK